MPYRDRPGKRQRPLEHESSTVVFDASDDIQVYAAPGYMLFIERMWHGDYQQIPVDPDEVRDLVEALNDALEFVTEEKAARVAASSSLQSPMEAQDG